MFAVFQYCFSLFYCFISLCNISVYVIRNYALHGVKIFNINKLITAIIIHYNQNINDAK